MNQPAHLEHPQHDSTLDDIFGEFRAIMSRSRDAARRARSARRPAAARRRVQQQRVVRQRNTPTKTQVKTGTAADHLTGLIARWAAAQAVAEASRAAYEQARADATNANDARADAEEVAAHDRSERDDAYAKAWDERMRSEGLDPDTLPREGADTELSPDGEVAAEAAEALAEEYVNDHLDNPDAINLDGDSKTVGDLIADAHPDGGELNLDTASTEFDPGLDAAAGVSAGLGAGVGAGTGAGVDQ